MSNPSPIIIPAPAPSTTRPATIIFLHGFGDDAHGWTDLVSQIHSANKLSHVKWILPNAPQNRDAMTQAWYQPKPFSPIPMPQRSAESEADDDEDDEEGMMKSVDYICGLIAKEVEEGKVPLDRIVVGGFSQGCAVSLLVGLLSRYRGELGGVVGLSGYLPLEGKIRRSVAERKEGGKNATKWFLAHGSMDRLVPRRMFTSYKASLERWEGDNVEARVYEGMPHSTTGEEIRDLCNWLERALPIN
uniref:Acyl-protein thioesterase 1 n=1 Tax=Cladonia uncialis subsp. uncialis TaxID=180999 RepID=A0A2K9YDX9_CLAUC|nr:putative lysophospholipase II [Cladonia uncialis subsp. uncialis]